MGNLNESEIRMRSGESAARVAAPADDIGNLLVHADWIAAYVGTGRLPQVELSVPGRIMETVIQIRFNISAYIIVAIEMDADAIGSMLCDAGVLVVVVEAG